MTLYELVKENIQPGEAAQLYGIKVSRHGKALCPFHDDQHPSLKLNEHYFYCFGCGAAGDVIDFTARLFDISLYEAAVKLAADFHLDPDKPPGAAALQVQKPHTDAQMLYQQEYLCVSVLSDYCSSLKRWKKLCAPQAPDSPIHPLFAEACHYLDYVEYLLDILLCGEPQERRTVITDCLTDNGIQKLQSRMAKAREEETHGQRKQCDIGLAA